MYLFGETQFNLQQSSARFICNTWTIFTTIIVYIWGPAGGWSRLSRGFEADRSGFKPFFPREQQSAGDQPTEGRGGEAGKCWEWTAPNGIPAGL